MPGNTGKKLTKSQKRVRAAIDAPSSSSSSDEGYGSHLDDDRSDDDESFHEDDGEEKSDDEVIPIDDDSDDGDIGGGGNESDGSAVSDTYGEAPLSLGSQESPAKLLGGDGLMTQASPASLRRSPRRAATPGGRPALAAALEAAAAAAATTPAAYPAAYPDGGDGGSAATTLLSGLSGDAKKSAAVTAAADVNASSMPDDAQMVAVVGQASKFTSPAARCSKKARLLSKAAHQEHEDSLATIGVGGSGGGGTVANGSNAAAAIQDELERAAARLEAKNGSRRGHSGGSDKTTDGTHVIGKKGESKVDEEVVCLESVVMDHTAKKTSNDMPPTTTAAAAVVVDPGASTEAKQFKDKQTKDKQKNKSKLKMKKSGAGSTSSGGGVPVSAVDSIIGGKKKNKDKKLKKEQQKAKDKTSKKKKVAEDDMNSATATIATTEKENTGNDGKPTTSAAPTSILNLADTDEDDDDFAPSSRTKKTKGKASKTGKASGGGGRKSSRARRTSSSASTGNLSEEDALAKAIEASLAESQSSSQPDRDQPKEEVQKVQVEEDAKPAASEAKKGRKTKRAESKSAHASNATDAVITEKTSEPASEGQPAKPAGVKRKKKKKKKVVSSFADGDAKASAPTAVENAVAKPSESSDAPAKKKLKKGASDTAGEAGEKKRPVPTATSASAAASAKPPPKKKKRTFQDQVYFTMLNSCMPYTLKTLAQATNSTEQQLNYVMLTLVDKNLVQKKDFSAGKTGRTKTLYWANQDAKSKDIENTDASEEQRVGTANELGGMQRQLRSIHTELQSVLAEPTNTDLAVQVQTAEAELAALRKQAAEMRERIAAAAGSGNSTNPAKLKKSINSIREVWRKRKLSCMDFVDNMADAMEKSRKDTIKVLDIETDEACGVKLPPKYDV